MTDSKRKKIRTIKGFFPNNIVGIVYHIGYIVNGIVYTGGDPMIFGFHVPPLVSGQGLCNIVYVISIKDS